MRASEQKPKTPGNRKRNSWSPDETGRYHIPVGKVFLGAYLPLDVRQALERRADADDESMSTVTVRALRTYLDGLSP